MGNDRKTVCSFFTGCGGLDLGLEGGFEFCGKEYPSNGFETVFACDISPFAKRCYEASGRNGEFRLASIVDIVKKDQETPFLPHADIVTGGFPCQDWSLAGKRQGFSSFKDHLGIARECDKKESRGMLYWWMREAIKSIRPSIMIAENVKGLTYSQDAVGRIRSDFAQMGYEMQTQVLNAADFGVPQNRERILFIGANKDRLTEEGRKLLAKFHNAFREAHLFPTGSEDKLTCRKALAGLEEPEKSSDESQKAYSKAAYMEKGQGQTEIPLDGQAPTIRSEHHGNIEYRRLSREHGGRHSRELEAGLAERRLTVRECARLQSFPDWMRFVPAISGSEAYKVVGNAVPPVLAHAIGAHLARNWGRLFGG